MIPGRTIGPKMIDVVDLMTSYLKQLKLVAAAMVTSGDHIIGFDDRRSTSASSRALPNPMLTSSQSTAATGDHMHFAK